MAKTGYDKLRDKFKNVNVHIKTYEKLLIMAQERGISVHEQIKQLVNAIFPDNELTWDFQAKRWIRRKGEDK